MFDIPPVSLTFSPAPLRELMEELTEDELLAVADVHLDACRNVSMEEIRDGADDAFYSREANQYFDVVSGYEIPQMEAFVAAMENRPVTVDFHVAEALRRQMPTRVAEEDDDRWHMEVPAELQAAWKQYFGHETFVQTARRFDEVIPHADAAAHLYGAIGFKDFLAMVRRRTGFFCRNRYETDWLAFRLTNRCRMAYVNDDILYHRALIAPEDNAPREGDATDDVLAPRAAFELLKSTEGKPRFAPPMESFLDWADPNWYEDNPAIRRFEDWLGDTFEEEFLASTLIHQTLDMIRMGARLPDVLRQFEDDDIEVDDELRGILQGVCDNTRLWLNKGHTASESLARISGKLANFSLGFRKKADEDEP